MRYNMEKIFSKLVYFFKKNMNWVGSFCKRKIHEWIRGVHCWNKESIVFWGISGVATAWPSRSDLWQVNLSHGLSTALIGVADGKGNTLLAVWNFDDGPLIKSSINSIIDSLHYRKESNPSAIFFSLTIQTLSYNFPLCRSNGRTKIYLFLEILFPK